MIDLDGSGDVVLTQFEYAELMECKEFLNCLLASGVDSWDGWDGAMELMNSNE